MWRFFVPGCVVGGGFGWLGGACCCVGGGRVYFGEAALVVLVWQVRERCRMSSAAIVRQRRGRGRGCQRWSMGAAPTASQSRLGVVPTGGRVLEVFRCRFRHAGGVAPSKVVVYPCHRES